MAAAGNQAMTSMCGKEFQEFHPPARAGIDTGSMGADLVRHATDGAELVDEEEEEGQGSGTSEEVEIQGRRRIARGRERQTRTPSPMGRDRVDGTPDMILTEFGDVGLETRAMRQRQAQITSRVQRLVRAEQNRTVTMLERRLCGLAFKNFCRRLFANLPLVGERPVGAMQSPRE